jgi:hypothetical protein
MSDYDASDRKHVRLAERAARIDDRQKQEFVREIMATAVGRAWVLDLLVRAHVFASSHTGNALQTAFNEGERNIGLLLLISIMTACPDQYVVMMRESDARSSTADARRERNRPNADGRDQPVVESSPTAGDDAGDDASDDEAPDDTSYVDYGAKG